MARESRPRCSPRGQRAISSSVIDAVGPVGVIVKTAEINGGRYCVKLPPGTLVLVLSIVSERVNALLFNPKLSIPEENDKMPCAV